MLESPIYSKPGEHILLGVVRKNDKGKWEEWFGWRNRFGLRKAGVMVCLLRVRSDFEKLYKGVEGVRHHRIDKFETYKVQKKRASRFFFCLI